MGDMELPIKLMTAIYAFIIYGFHSLCRAGVDVKEKNTNEQMVERRNPELEVTFQNMLGCAILFGCSCCFRVGN
jgi:hypothetical protein